MKLHFEIKDKDTILKNHGLQEGGPVQQYIDQECIDQMEPYTPRLNGNLIKAATMGTVIGSGEINQTAPYAHYLYEGVVYVDPNLHCAGFNSSTPGPYYGQWFSRKGVIKVKSNPPRELQFYGGGLRGKKWFERMKADHKDDILRGAQAIMNRGDRV